MWSAPDQRQETQGNGKGGTDEVDNVEKPGKVRPCDFVSQNTEVLTGWAKT